MKYAAFSSVRRLFVPSYHIRSQFVTEISRMYGKEVPLYETLLAHIEHINREITGKTSASREEMVTEHHGAVRVGTEEEMRGIARLFNVMGMHPVNYYNLTVANLPVHATAFRPVMASHNHFRMFVSLLRHDLLPEALQAEVKAILSRRKIFTPELLEILVHNERQGGLTEAQADIFVQESLKTFKRHTHACVPLATYKKLLEVNSLLADIVCFPTPHINHLTPEIKSKVNAQGIIEGEPGIVRLHRELNQAGIETTPVIQGPPPGRRFPLLLGQGAIVAGKEQFLFPDGKGGFEPGEHRARFGEYETKGGAALTPAGRKLYDDLLARVRSQTNDKNPDYMEVLAREFEAFPDDPETLRKEGLIYVKYKPTPKGLAQKGKLARMSMDDLIEQGYVAWTPMKYEDFLPISAAGIFKSNLKEGGMVHTNRTEDRKRELEEALGQPILDSFALYAAQSAQSEQETLKALGVFIPKARCVTLKREVDNDPALTI